MPQSLAVDRDPPFVAGRFRWTQTADLAGHPAVPREPTISSSRMTTEILDWFATLGVSPGASNEEIVDAYHEKAKLYHPDRNPGFVEEATRRLQELNLAYEAATNPKRGRDANERDSPPVAENPPPRPRAPSSTPRSERARGGPRSTAPPRAGYSPRVPKHAGPLVYFSYVVAVVNPFFGIPLGIFVSTRKSKVTSRHGKWIITTSIVVLAILIAFVVIVASTPTCGSSSSGC
jgi:hypothetical protein